MTFLVYPFQAPSDFNFIIAFWSKRYLSLFYRMDFIAEYHEMNKIPSKIAVTYSFFDLFKVQTKSSDDLAKGFYWCGQVDTKLPDDVLGAFKHYIKTMKSELKQCNTKSNCGKMLWFFYQKLLEHGAFNSEIRRDIMSYMDICEYIIIE